MTLRRSGGTASCPLSEQHPSAYMPNIAQQPDCTFSTALAALAAGNPAAAAAAAAAAHGRAAAAAQASQQQTHEMTVPNELIGCIIGKGGSKIAEIR